MTTINRIAIMAKPRQPFLDWLHAADETSHDLTLEDLGSDPSIYLLPQCENDEEVRARIAMHVNEIFDEQLDSWYREPSSWPQRRDMETFERWFEWSSHSIIIDLCERPIRREQY